MRSGSKPQGWNQSDAIATAYGEGQDDLWRRLFTEQNFQKRRNITGFYQILTVLGALEYPVFSIPARKTKQSHLGLFLQDYV